MASETISLSVTAIKPVKEVSECYGELMCLYSRNFKECCNQSDMKELICAYEKVNYMGIE